MEYIKNIKQMNQMCNALFVNRNHEELISFPEKITLTLTNRCNYRCKMCYQKDFSGDMDWRIIDTLIPMLPFARQLQLFGGEPFLYHRIKELFQLANKNQCQIHMISNGSLLSEDMVESIVENNVFHIKFSIDAGTSSTYQYIRGGHFSKVISGISHITNKKVQKGSIFPVMHFNFLAMKSNIHELHRLVVTANAIGIDQINVFFPDCHSEELIKECLYFSQDYSDEQMMKAVKAGDRYGVRVLIPPLFRETTIVNRKNVYLAQKCDEPFTNLLLDLNGGAKLCCGGPTHIGNILEEHWHILWNNDHCRRLRRTINTNDQPEFCYSCRIRKQNPKDIKYHISNSKILETLQQV